MTRKWLLRSCESVDTEELDINDNVPRLPLKPDNKGSLTDCITWECFQASWVGRKSIWTWQLPGVSSRPPGGFLAEHGWKSTLTSQIQLKCPGRFRETTSNYAHLEKNVNECGLSGFHFLDRAMQLTAASLPGSSPPEPFFRTVCCWNGLEVR